MAKVLDIWLAVSLVVVSLFQTLSALDIDSSGYILYCPCMGRFGNQAEHFLGSLAFAKKLNRTLVLPPWVEYRTNSFKSIQVPFDRYFKVEPLLSFHRVITMEEFMKDLAPTIWPEGKRNVYCYRARQAIMSEGDGGCNAKDGNPFQSFWDTYNINFDNSVFYEPLTYDVERLAVVREWNNKFPRSEHFVLAFTGAPAAFPVENFHVHLHKFLHWSDHITQRVDKFIEEEIYPGRPFLAIHLRLGRDWVNVCKHANNIATMKRHLFASAQCLGYDFEFAPRLTKEAAREMCLPSKDTILRQVEKTVKETKVNIVVVTIDDDHEVFDELKESLADYKVNVIRPEPVDDHLDLAILGRATYFIGSCTSTYSAFAVRERRIRGLPVDFWASHLLSLGADEL